MAPKLQLANDVFEPEREWVLTAEQRAQIATFVARASAANSHRLSPLAQAEAVANIEQDLQDMFWIAGRDADDEASQWSARGERADATDAVVEQEGGYWALDSEWAAWDAAHPLQFTPELSALATALVIELVAERWVLLSHAVRADVAGELLGDIRNAHDTYHW